MTTHDPSEYIRGIQQILISDKKKIGFMTAFAEALERFLILNQLKISHFYPSKQNFGKYMVL